MDTTDAIVATEAEYELLLNDPRRPLSRFVEVSLGYGRMLAEPDPQRAVEVLSLALETLKDPPAPAEADTALELIRVQAEELSLVSAAQLGRQCAGDEIADIGRAGAVAERLPVDDADRAPARLRGEQHVVRPEVGMHQGPRAGSHCFVGGQIGAHGVADAASLRRDAGAVAVDERMPERRDQLRLDRVDGVLCVVDPGEIVERFVLPEGGVQLGALEQNPRRGVDIDAGELIALFGRSEIFHYQNEFVGRFVDIGEEAARRRDLRAGLQVLIEFHLAVIVAQ